MRHQKLARQKVAKRDVATRCLLLNTHRPVCKLLVCTLRNRFGAKFVHFFPNSVQTWPQNDREVYKLTCALWPRGLFPLPGRIVSSNLCSSILLIYSNFQVFAYCNLCYTAFCQSRDGKTSHIEGGYRGSSPSFFTHTASGKAPRTPSRRRFFVLSQKQQGHPRRHVFVGGLWKRRSKGAAGLNRNTTRGRSQAR